MPSKPPRQNLLTLSRIQLYDLVWSRPLADIASEYQTSSATIRSRCLDVHVPLPDEADATRIQRGEAPASRKPLPSPRDIRRTSQEATDAQAAPPPANDPATPSASLDAPAAASAPATPPPEPPPELPKLPYEFTRESLYALVWSHPPRQLAMHFGMSDVAIAKRCRALQIPIPPRGYWARVQAGQRPPKPRLKALKPELLDASKLRFGTPSPQRQAELDPKAVPPPPVRTPIDERLDALGLQPDAPEEWARNADDSNPPPGWPERLRGPARLPILETLTRASEQRGRRLLTHLIETTQKLGWRFSERQPEPEPSNRTRYEDKETIEKRAAHFIVEDEIVTIRVKESHRRTDHVVTDAERARQKRDTWFTPERWDFHPSKELSLSIHREFWSYAQTTIKDGARKPLERRMRDILNAMYAVSQQIKTERAERLERERLQKLAEERRARVRVTREAHHDLVRQLERDAGAWERARRLRRYLRALRRSVPPGQTLHVDLEGEPVDLFTFGERFANQLDPLHPAPREWQFMPAPPQGYYYPREDDELKTLRTRVSRALGYDWEKAYKLGSAGATPTQPPED